ncbi:hypothetical protein [Janibacter terrae]|uniref:hypothetical protein n=1 Tax=Janibacter terrae TaxID=103817 RepID=UPI000830A844|nr:hypothetical protein [Janibacter terrae]MBA4084839.1 hypothetical protein [Kytococcus sp.]
MSALAELSLPRVVLLADALGVDETEAATAFVGALRDLARPVVAVSLAGDPGTPVARRALAALETAPDLLVLTAPGLLSRLDARGGTLADAGTALRYKGVSTGIVLGTVAGSPGLGHALALHAEVLRARELPLLGALSGGPQDLSWSVPDQWGTMAP